MCPAVILVGLSITSIVPPLSGHGGGGGGRGGGFWGVGISNGVRHWKEFGTGN